MKPVSKILVVSAVALSLLGGGVAAYASKGEANDALGVNQAAVSLTDAVTAALAQVPGKPAKAEFEQDEANAKPVWAVEIVTADGKVMDVTVDANSGTVLKQQADTADAEKGEKGEKDSEHTGKNAQHDKR